MQRRFRCRPSFDRSRAVSAVRAAVALAGLMAFVGPGLAGAQPYSAQRLDDVVRLEDAGSKTVVSIAPAVGNIVFGMSVKGHEILRWPYGSIEEFKAKPGLSGIPFVGPFANRLDEPAFYANGRRYSFDMGLGNVRGPIPIHGFLSTTSRWQLVEAKADARAAWATSRLEFFREPMWMTQFPFAHTIVITHRLQGGVLQVSTVIENQSTEPMPVAVGFHPYFRLTDSMRDQWSLSIGARTRWLLSRDKIPTGETEPIERLVPDPGRARLEDYNLDDVFGDLVRDDQGRAQVAVVGRAQRLDIVLGPTWRALVIWAPNPANTGRGSQNIAAPRGPSASTGQLASNRNFVCIEPMAGITNAMNLAHRGLYNELQSIPPGRSWEASFWVKPSGF
jgi:aldose 1-epimerase